MTAPGHIPVRSCFGCRTRAPKSELLRLVVHGDGAEVDADVIRDPVERGRGRWVCPRRRCLEIASRKLHGRRARAQDVSAWLDRARARAERRARIRAAGLRRRRLPVGGDGTLVALAAIIEGIDAQRG